MYCHMMAYSGLLIDAGELDLDNLMDYNHRVHMNAFVLKFLKDMILFCDFIIIAAKEFLFV